MPLVLPFSMTQIVPIQICFLDNLEWKLAYSQRLSLLHFQTNHPIRPTLPLFDPSHRDLSGSLSFYQILFSSLYELVTLLHI